MIRPDSLSYPPHHAELARQWQASTRQWREWLGQVDDLACEWQPFARSHSIGSILLHMIEQETYWMEEIIAGRRRSRDEAALLRVDQNLPGEEVWAVPPGLRFEDLLDLQEFFRARSLRTLAQADPQAQFGDPGETVSEIVLRLMAHEHWHAGQAYLHKMHFGWGGKPPT